MKLSKKIIQWSSSKPALLKAADKLGRGKGGARILDLLPPLPKKIPRPDVDDWNQRLLSAVWIGHSTVLMKIGGFTILTDPVFSNRVGLGLGLVTAGPKRLIAPALALKELPKIDLLLLSHAHFDHLDLPSLKFFKGSERVVAAKKTKDLLDGLPFQSIHEVGWYEKLRFGELRVTAYPCKHWGARTLYDTHRSYNSYLLEAGAQKIFFGGDTAYHSELPSGPVDLAIFGIGGYNPWVHSHATPEEAMSMAEQIGAKNLLPMHHSTFRLSAEPVSEPIERLLASRDESSPDICIQKVGEQWCPFKEAPFVLK